MVLVVQRVAQEEALLVVRLRLRVLQALVEALRVVVLAVQGLRVFHPVRGKLLRRRMSIRR